MAFIKHSPENFLNNLLNEKKFVSQKNPCVRLTAEQQLNMFRYNLYQKPN